MGKSKFIKKLRLEKPEQCEYSVDISNAKKRDKFIKRVERIVRSSMEYRDYIQFLRENMDMDSCAFFANVTSNTKENNENKKVKVEVHHEPFTLYDYVNTVVEKYIEEGIPIDSMDIAEEVMELHYNNNVGLIPLSKTIHQIVHNTRKIPIPLYMCYGAYADFVKMYKPYLEELGLMDKLEEKVNLTKTITPESFDAIQKEFTYLEVEGQESDISHMDMENDMVA